MAGSTARRGVFVDKGVRNSGSSGIAGICSKIFRFLWRFAPDFHREKYLAADFQLIFWQGRTDGLANHPFQEPAAPAAGESRGGWRDGWCARSRRRAGAERSRAAERVGGESGHQRGAVAGGDEVHQRLQRGGLHGALQGAAQRACCVFRRRRGLVGQAMAIGQHQQFARQATLH